MNISITQAAPADQLDFINMLQQTLRNHLRMLDLDDQTPLHLYIESAIQTFERKTRRSLMSREITMGLDGFPCTRSRYFVPPGYIYLPRGQVTDVTEITYKNEDGNSTTLTTADYTLDLNYTPARIAAVLDWPATDDSIGAVTIKYDSGWANPTDVPADIRNALIVMAGHMHEHPEGGDMPLAVSLIMESYTLPEELVL